MVGSKFNGDARHDLQVLAPNAKALRDWGEQMHAMLIELRGAGGCADRAVTCSCLPSRLREGPGEDLSGGVVDSLP